MVNHTCCIEDIDALFMIRFFVKDLHKQVVKMHQELKEACLTLIIVYRAVNESSLEAIEIFKQQKVIFLNGSVSC